MIVNYWIRNSTLIHGRRFNAPRRWELALLSMLCCLSHTMKFPTQAFFHFAALFNYLNALFPNYIHLLCKPNSIEYKSSLSHYKNDWIWTLRLWFTRLLSTQKQQLCMKKSMPSLPACRGNCIVHYNVPTRWCILKYSVPWLRCINNVGTFLTSVSMYYSCSVALAWRLGVGWGSMGERALLHRQQLQKE